MHGSSPGGRVDALRYDVDVDLSAESAFTTVLSVVGANKRVLELGCNTGVMTKALASEGNDVIGIEIDPRAAERAAEHAERVIVADLDAMPSDLLAEDERFDVIVAADVLEHLKEPVAVLRRLARYLSVGGYVVASIPNVAHESVRLALLQGAFPYADRGLLDRTHLRFFTRHTIRELFADADLCLLVLDPFRSTLDVGVPVDRTSVPMEVLETIGSDPDADILQYIAIAYPVPIGAPEGLARRMHFVLDDLESSRAQLVALRAHAAAVEQEADAERALRRGLEGELVKLGAEHAELRKLTRRGQIELFTMQSELSAASQTLAEVQAALGDQVDALSNELAGIRESRGWRLLSLWWSVRKIITRPGG